MSTPAPASRSVSASVATPPPAAPAPPIVVRDPDLDFEPVPRAWMAGSAAATAVSNGVNLLFPPGERFFVRSVKHFLDQIDDPALRAQIKAFFGQEGRHARAHDRFNVILRGQGYEIDRFLEVFEKVCFEWLEPRVSPELRLATTAAAEHFTAIMAEGAFTEGMLEAAHPTMQQLMAWHAAEEIEHRAVAYDVLQRVDPRYRTRVLGMVVATLLLSGFWIAGATTLLRQDGLGWLDALRELRALRRRADAAGGARPAVDRSIARRVFARGIREYLRRDFHPSKKAMDHLAPAWYASHGLPMPEAA